MKVIPPVLAIVLITALVSCDSDEPVKQCLPLSIQIESDSVRFNYDNSKLLVGFTYHNEAKTPYKGIDVEYATGKISKVKQWSSSPTGGTTVQSEWIINYDPNDLPSQIIQTESSNPGYTITTSVTHDSKGRLESLSSVSEGNETSAFLGGISYEYNDDDNVSKVYYSLQNLSGATPGAKVLARENKVFVSKPPFFTRSKELRFVLVYLFKIHPSAGSVALSKWYRSGFNSGSDTPTTVNFEMRFDGDAQIEIMTAIGPTPAYGDMLFTRGKFDCN